MIDLVTGWFEQAQPYGLPIAFRYQQIFYNTWLALYPRLREIEFNNRGEFKTQFRETCANIGPKEKTSLPWNPQLNAIIVRIYQLLVEF